MPKMRLTDTAVSRISKPAKRTEYFDSDLRGFMLRVSPNGSKSFAVMTRIKQTGGAGKQVRVTIGEYPSMKVDEARAKARDVKRTAKEGTDPRPQKMEGKDPNEIDTLFYGVSERGVRGYMDKLKDSTKERSWQETERIYLHDIATAVTGDGGREWQYRPAQSITKRDIIELLDRKANTPYAHNRALAVLRSFFGWLESRGILDNPPSFRKLAMKEKKRERVPGFDPVTEEEDHDEIRAIWHGATTYPFGRMVRFLLVTGKRKGEVADLTDAELDLDGGRWIIPAERAKNGEADIVPLSDLAVEILREAMIERDGDEEKPGPFVFSTTGGRKPIAGFSKSKTALDKAIAKWWTENIERDPMEPWRLHDLRRTVASYIRELGFSRDVADAVLAHKLTGITGTYVKNPMTQQKAVAVAAWTNKLRQITEGSPANVVDMADARGR